MGGGQVGVNYEFWGGVVVGAEAMFDWLPNTSNTISVTNAASGTASATINNRWLTTATGKLGYAWDRVPATEPELYCRGHTGTGRFAGDVISVNNRNINMFTAGVNYKFGGWGY